MGVFVNYDSDTWASPNIRAYQIAFLAGDYAADIAFRWLCHVGGYGYGAAWWAVRHPLRLVRVDVLARMGALSWGELVRAYDSAGDATVENMGEDEYHALIEMVSRVAVRAYAVTNGGQS